VKAKLTLRISEVKVIRIIRGPERGEVTRRCRNCIQRAKKAFLCIHLLQIKGQVSALKMKIV
jgi:hypothetical protein